jgi:hypothetical protein
MVPPKTSGRSLTGAASFVLDALGGLVTASNALDAYPHHCRTIDRFIDVPTPIANGYEAI